MILQLQKVPSIIARALAVVYQAGQVLEGDKLEL